MTDREAIRRLAATIARYGERNGMGQLRGEVMGLLNDLAEPAAPTDRTKLELDAYNRGHADGLASARRLNEPAAPTVTREQAAEVGWLEVERLREAIREYVRRNSEDDYTPAGYQAWQTAKDRLVKIALEGK